MRLRDHLVAAAAIMAAGACIGFGAASMADPFAGRSVGLSDPPTSWSEVTPSDEDDLPTAARCLYIGADGAVAIVTTGGSTVTLPALKAGTILPSRVKRVLATGTTCSSIHAGW